MIRGALLSAIVGFVVLSVGVSAAEVTTTTPILVDQEGAFHDPALSDFHGSGGPKNGVLLANANPGDPKPTARVPACR